MMFDNDVYYALYYGRMVLTKALANPLGGNMN